MKKSKNTLGIRYVTGGPPVLMAVINQLIDALDAIRVQRSVDIDAAVTSEGTLLTLRNPSTGGIRTTGKLLPFTLYDASTGSTLKVGITPGTVNGISPTFTGASPSGTLSATPPPLLTITETTYFFIKVIGTFGDPDSYVVTVETNTTGDIPSGTEITGTGFTSFLWLGTAPVESGALMVPESLCSTNLGVESLGNFNF